MRPRQVLSLGLVLLMLPGCSSWRPAPGSPDPALLPAETKEVRVQLSSGSRLVLHRPALLSDSLRGVALKGHSPRQASDSTQAVVPVTDIRKLETLHADGGKTVLCILGTLLILGALGTLAYAASMDGFMQNMGDNSQPAPPPARATR